MLSLNGVSAWIEVDGKELEQYDIQENLGQSQVACWVATQASKGFSVVFRDNSTHRDHALCSTLLLDGESIKGKVLRPSSISIGSLPNLAAPAGRTVQQSGQVISATCLRPFEFSKLELTDEDEYLGLVSTHLGEVRIIIHRAHILQAFLPVSDPGLASGFSKVHERSKKAVSHCVSYGQERKTDTHYGIQVRYLDGNAPLATFIFKYRELGLLQANGIIPRPPPIKRKAAISADVLDLTTNNEIKPEPTGEEIEIIDNAVRKKGVTLPGSSNVRHESEARPAKKVKREKKFVPMGEIIDLT